MLKLKDFKATSIRLKLLSQKCLISNEVCFILLVASKEEE